MRGMLLCRGQMRDYKDLLFRISNAYYNLGLERAKLSDLSGAAELLKKSLHFNKYQTDARNLLGLIYYEMGEVPEALVQWVISLNLDPEDNRADHYLDEVQRKPGALERETAAIRKFNQALYHAQHGAEDLAMIGLNQIVREKPDFIKARLLLALLYLDSGQNTKAGSVLMRVLKTDRNNSLALILMDETKKRTGKAEVEKNRMKNAFSHRRMEDDDVILPKARREATPGQTVMYIIGGVALSFLVFWLMILPSVRRQYNIEANERIAQNSRELNMVNASYEELSRQYASVSSAYEDAAGRLRAFEEENAAFTSMYRLLVSINEDYAAGNVVQAAESYLSIDRSMITEEPLLGMLQDVDRYMLNEGFDAIVSMGTDSWNGGRLADAEHYYDLALSMRGDDPEAMYLKARLLQSQDRITEANAIFDAIIGGHPESPYAERAMEARGY